MPLPSGSIMMATLRVCDLIALRLLVVGLESTPRDSDVDQ